MITLAQLWLPVVLSAVFVFIASSILHMALRAWHAPDSKGFSNEDEVGAAMRKGSASAGLYMIPYCTPEKMKEPGMMEKFKAGPAGVVFLRQPGAMNMGAMLGQWFGFCVLVSFFAEGIAAHALSAGSDAALVFHTTGLAALMGYAFGVIPDAIWWGHPWRSVVKHFIDGLVYAVITGATFARLWPH